MTSLHLLLLILLMRVAHFLDIFTSIITYGTFKILTRIDFERVWRLWWCNTAERAFETVMQFIDLFGYY